MKSFFFLLLLSGGLATSASAQSGWGTSDSWDAPAKKSTKKAPAKTGKSQSANQDKALNNNGAMAPEAMAPATAPEPAPAAGGFAPAGGGGSSASGGSGGMSVAPGTPVMMQSGRNVLRDEAIAARERRMRHQAGKPAAAAPAPAPVPMAAPAPATAAQVDATNAGTASNGGMSAGPKKTSMAPKAKPVKKAPAAPAGW
jgi:hypothetical protein